MSELGSDVVMLRHPNMADIKRKSAASYWSVIIVCGFLAVIAFAIVSFTLPDMLKKLMQGDWQHLQRSDVDPLALIVIPLLSLPFLPKLMKQQVRMQSQRLLVGERGLQMTVAHDPASPFTSPPVLWSEVKQAQLVYRRVDGIAMGVRITTKPGKQLFLSAARWVKEDASDSTLLSLGKGGLALGLAKDKYIQLQSTDLVKTLQAKGLSIEDEPEHLWDKIAVVLGLSLAAAAVILALVVVYLR
jgi:hypothetical protein